MMQNTNISTSTNTNIPMNDRRSPGNGQSSSDPEPEQLELLNYSNQVNQNDCNNLTSNHLHQICNEGLKASTSSSSSLSTSATTASNYSREGKNNNNSINSGFAVIHRYGRGMKLNSRNERTILGKSQSTTDCDTSSEHDIWVENKASTSAKPVLPPLVNDKVTFSKSYKTENSISQHTKDDNCKQRIHQQGIYS